ncbi:hypothetical protein D3C78_1724990 [compost metagenome]
MAAKVMMFAGVRGKGTTRLPVPHGSARRARLMAWVSLPALLLKVVNNAASSPASTRLAGGSARICFTRSCTACTSWP